MAVTAAGWCAQHCALMTQPEPGGFAGVWPALSGPARPECVLAARVATLQLIL
jgi:hypothetical protein